MDFSNHPVLSAVSEVIKRGWTLQHQRQAGKAHFNWGCHVDRQEGVRMDPWPHRETDEGPAGGVWDAQWSVSDLLGALEQETDSYKEVWD